MSKQFFKNDSEALFYLADGNINAYRYLFNNHFSNLCNFLLVYLHNRELSEEIAIDIFAYIWEKRQTLQIKATFKSFLFAAAKNKAISQYRKEHHKWFVSIDASESVIQDDSSSQFFLEDIELRTIINEAILKLPEKSRQIYLLAWEENLSYKEIASRFGLSPKTVENHIGIALRKLRESLKPYYKQIFSLWIVMQFID